jgi:threonine dehydrogenase-like Zn-dependent dehydrogenase
VERIKPGDRVSVEPAVSCRQCDQCLAGRPHTCWSLRFLGSPSQLDGALAEFLLKPGGTLVMVGILIEERISFDISRLRRKELRVQNVRRQNRCLDRALDLMASRTIDAGFMATHTFPFGHVQEAFETVFDHRDGVIKAMISVA